MRFAFSTSLCPAWDLPALVTHAQALAYAGVELHGISSGDRSGGFDPSLSDPAKTRQAFEQAGLGVACVSSDIAMSFDRRADARSADAIRALIDLSAALGCPCVRTRDVLLHARQGLASAMVRFGDWLLPLGDYAADRKITLAIANGPTFQSAHQIWTMLDRIAHPAIACAWDLLSATLAGESPATSVQVLNSKIQYVSVQDAKIEDGTFTPCALGEGTVPVLPLLHGLAGIGYGGWVTLDGRAPVAPTTGDDETIQVLSQALAKMKTWIHPAQLAAPAKAVSARSARPAGV